MSRKSMQLGVGLFKADVWIERHNDRVHAQLSHLFC
jgi:hypothetical protein